MFGVSFLKLIFLTSVTMIAFGSNSIFARLALSEGPLGAQSIDPANYTMLRLLSGAIMLAIMVNWSGRPRQNPPHKGNLLSAIALFVYAVTLSFSYTNIDTGLGALVLFACVQATMIGWSIFKGDRPRVIEILGNIIALIAFVWLVSPGLSAPDPVATFLMAMSGIAWGVYSLRGRNEPDPLAATAGNFILCVIPALCLTILFWADMHITLFGALMAILSGAVTSGIGYALWYRVLKQISATRAAIVQLTVPVIAGIGGVIFVSEDWTIRFTIASSLILGGVAMAILAKQRRQI